MPHLRPVTLLAGILAILAACEAPRTEPAPGTAAGAAPESQAEAAARASAGSACPATTQGMARLATRGDGPVVLRSGPGAGTAARSSVTLPPGGSDGCPEPATR